MSGEASKKSGEIGELLAEKLLDLIGWQNSMSRLNLNCAAPTQHGCKSHGDDRLFIYDNPFFDGVTDVVHVSVKHTNKGYPKGDQAIRNKLKEHLTELGNLVSCAKHDPTVNESVGAYGGQPQNVHKGLLIWVHSNNESLEKDIREIIGATQPPIECKDPIVLIDSGRASFLYFALSHFKSLAKTESSFYYPRLGNAIYSDNQKHGEFIPLELIASDLLPIRAVENGKKILYLYVRERFSNNALMKMCSLALDFGDAWVDDFFIGFDDFDESNHGEKRDQVLLSLRGSKSVNVFSYKANVLNLLEATK